MNNYIYLAIFVMAIVTYLTRAISLVLFRKKIRNKFIQSFLTYMPFGVLSAMIFPNILYSTESLISAICGGLVSLLLALKNKGLLIVALGATVAVYIVEQILSFLK